MVCSLHPFWVLDRAPREAGRGTFSGKRRTHLIPERVYPVARLKTGSIRQTVLLPGTPGEVYAALMTTKGHEGFTGAPARISSRVGGSFEAWGGYIQGKNLELVPGKRIVQAWRPSEEGWPARYYSKVTFVFRPAGRKTRMRFVHSGVPSDHLDHLSLGWKESYWQPLAAYLKKAKRPVKARD